MATCAKPVYLGMKKVAVMKNTNGLLPGGTFRTTSLSMNPLLLKDRLEQQQLINSVLFENTGSATAMVDDDLTVRVVNSDFLQLSGYNRMEIAGGVSWMDLVHEEDRSRILGYHRRRSTDGVAPRRYEFRFLTRDKGERHVLATVSVVPRSMLRIVSLEDITPLRQAREEICALATYDSVTNIPNRELFLERLDKEFEDVQSQGFAIVFLDISRFRVINEVFGHVTGDELLGEFAARLKSSTGLEDSVARFGGDQFLILLRGVTAKKEFDAWYARAISILAQPYMAGDVPVHLRFHSGVTFCRSGEQVAKGEVVQSVISSMSQAKREGVEYWLADGRVTDKERERLTMEVEMLRDIEEERFELCYQPIHRLGDSRLEGFEALARWTLPGKGMVPPDVFIPLAEERGMIMPLGTLLLRKACAQLREWEERFAGCPPRLAVNISGVQLLHPEFLQVVRQVIRESGCNPGLLCLEITEGSILRDLEKSRQVVDILRSMGISVVLDDFGTGYSSLSHLQKLSLDAIKVDRSFVSRSGTESVADPDIVKAVLSLGRGIGLRVVAEGVETPEQLATLTAWGADLGQGYHFSRPVSPGQATLLVEDSRNQQERGAKALTESVSPSFERVDEQG